MDSSPDYDQIEGRQLVDRRIAVLFGTMCALGLASGATAGKNKKKKKSKSKGKSKPKSSGGAADVVKTAQKYKGAKYAMGGSSPSGFDCSGFTWYVYNKATGMDIGRSVTEQWKQGKSVGRGDWQPGDIVFFENTFERGLSHNGIYIGGNEFIHAENEDTGVVISTLASGYYDDHYAGARRLL